MAISFYFYWDWIYSIWEWLFLILPVTAYFFLIIGCSNLKKDKRNFESVKFLNTIGIILLTWIIINRFLPYVIFSYSFPDYLIGIFYGLTVIIINHTLHIILGFAFILFGSRNKEHKGGLGLLGGISFALAWTLVLIINVIGSFSAPMIIMMAIMMAILMLIISLSIVGAILILVYTILIKQVFLIIFAAVFLSYHTLYFVINLILP